MIEKSHPFRSAKWLDAVRDIGFCVRCGAFGVQAAHRNEGKGMGMKVSDCLSAALCRTCHTEIDHGKGMTKEERRAELNAAIVKTVEVLVSHGKVVVA
jgi:ferredoxin